MDAGSVLKTMHAAFICNEFPPAPHGGIGSLYFDLAHGLVEQGHLVTVVGFSEKESFSGDESRKNLKIVRLPPSRAKNHKVRIFLERWQLRRTLAKLHSETCFDFVEAADYGGDLFFGAPGKIPSFIRISGTNFFFDKELGRNGDPFEYWIEKKALAKADHLISVSRYAGEKTVEYAQLAGKKCEVIYNAVDTDFFKPSAGPVEEGLVVYANSINPKKGIQQFVEAMNFLGGNYPKLRFVVIGQDTQPARNGRTYIQFLLDMVRPEFRPRITFTGRLDRHTGVLPWLRRAQICCYPSHMETFGIAPVEAMSLGKPTIFSKTGPGPEVIVDGESGLLCDPFNATDVAAKIKCLLDNPVAAARLGENARKRAIACFDKKNWVKQNIEFYNASLLQKVKID